MRKCNAHVPFFHSLICYLNCIIEIKFRAPYNQWERIEKAAYLWPFNWVACAFNKKYRFCYLWIAILSSIRQCMSGQSSWSRIKCTSNRSKYFNFTVSISEMKLQRFINRAQRNGYSACDELIIAEFIVMCFYSFFCSVVIVVVVFVCRNDAHLTKGTINWITMNQLNYSGGSKQWCNVAHFLF